MADGEYRCDSMLASRSDRILVRRLVTGSPRISTVGRLDRYLSSPRTDASDQVQRADATFHC